MLITEIKLLLKTLGLPLKKLTVDKKILQQFPLKVPKNYVELMQKNNLRDPLLLQILPTTKEKNCGSGYKKNPLGENKYSPIPGLIHKYYGRVLLLTSANCCINCRFCFRRYTRTTAQDWKKIYNYIAKDNTIEEVILSGGDPLMLSDNHLKNIVAQVAAIKHVRYLRIHSRMPILMPKRITQSFLNIFTYKKHLQILMVVHCNHPNEVSKKVLQTLEKLNEAGITVLNQAVLLKDINDSPLTLKKLNQLLFKAKVLPYYLHILDKVSGAQHFYVNKKTAKKIIQKLREQVPGYLVPKLVCDTPDGKAKKLLQAE